MAAQSQSAIDSTPAKQPTARFPEETGRKALLILNLRNDLLAEDAKLKAMQPSDLVPRIKALLPIFRSSGSVIWACSESGTEDSIEYDRIEGKDILTVERGTKINDMASDMTSPSFAQSSQSASPGMSQSSMSKCGTSDSKIDEKTVERGHPWASENVPENETSSPTGHNGKSFEPFVLGSKEAEVFNGTQDLIDHENDFVLLKQDYSAFKSTSLLSYLQCNGVTELYICGLFSNTSIYATTLDAIQEGFDITLFADCLGYRSANHHELALKKITEHETVKVMTSIEYCQALKSLPKEVGSRKRLDPTSDEPMSSQADSEAQWSDIESGEEPTRPANMIKATRWKQKKKAKPRDTSLQIKTNGEDQNAAVRGNTNGYMEIASTTSETATPNADETVTAEDETIQLAIANVPREPTRSSKKPSISQVNNTESLLNGLPSPTFHVLEAVSASLQDVGLYSRAADVTPGGAETTMSPTHMQTAKVQTIRPIHSRSVSRTHIRGNSCPPLGPGDVIGEGDSRIVYNLLSPESREDVFARVKREVQWQTMYHRGGEVPRLVAVEGDIGSNGSFPIYRHPADESPPLLPFSNTVSKIRDEVQKVLKHPVNHVLIQCYRHGQDYISEHSDKTLDIVRNSSIVNVSLGAQRTMTLRTKKSGVGHPSGAIPEMARVGVKETSIMDDDADHHYLRPSEKAAAEEFPKPRTTQRISMPHNSMFILGQVTNMKWLHGIRPDKRPIVQKSEEEQAYNGERISLTFRYIGTYLDKHSERIWGQGARSKDKSTAAQVVNGDTYEAEQMIKAFGSENQQSEFDWDGAYGLGFDVLNITNANPKLFASGDQVADSRVKICLAEKGLLWDKQESLLYNWKTSNIPHEEAPRIKFIDHDATRSEIEGDLAILLYLETYCVSDALLPPMDRRADIAAVYSRTFASDTLLVSWRNAYRILQDFQPSEAAIFLVPKHVQTDRERVVSPFRAELSRWEHEAIQTEYIATNSFSMADCAFWPVLNEIVHDWIDWSAEKYPRLAAYWKMLLTRESIRLILSEFPDSQSGSDLPVL